MANNARNATDLERKYNFSSLLGLTQNIKMNKDNITRVQNELANMLNTLIINLKDVLDSQSEVSLWFYSGTPTTANKPYTNWSTPKEHYGDIYYDQDTGYVYQYFSDGWIRKNDLNLIQAMALTNVELDVETDHERKVYFVQPTPPYSSGDWWILEDGTLKICQIGKTTGQYDINDFIVSSKYVATVASKTGDVLTVLKGTVTEITENYVKYTDLATGGSTTINGANITTGTINTDNVTIGNGNVQLDEEGLKLKNGAKVVGENGLMNTYLFTNNDFSFCGYEGDDPLGWNNTSVTKKGPSIVFNIPDGLNITSAKVILYHAPALASGTKYIESTDTTQKFTTWGYCRNLKLYKVNNITSRQYEYELASELRKSNNTQYTEISGAFGTNGWTATVPNNTMHNTEKATSIDIKSSISTGLNELKIQTGNSISSSSGGQDIAERSAFVYAMIKIDGYMSY